ncbi:hypothetical protein [Motilimonas eburnea]|uniref:hypothetical protein n=1 Tax=Motilimonas eburnea TaxID=1737488 RepID=UPI001E626AF3|nr:hypothetical protein [Motilimonas eburnea]MCE2571750.1 hypothetical protein [Motilimonas eburnea]
MTNQDKIDRTHHTETMLTAKAKLGARNLNALTSADHTIKARLAAFKGVKGGKRLTQKRALELYDEYTSAFSALVSLKRKARYNEYPFASPSRFSQQMSKQTAQMHRDISRRSSNQAIARATNRRIELIEKYIDRVTPDTSGSKYIAVTLTDSPAEVDYSSYTDKGEQYSSRCTYRKTDLNIKVTLPSNWYSRVYKKGLGEIDGLFTLDISSALVGEYGEGVDVRAATWLVRSLGSSFTVKRGFIARSGTASYHGKTLSSAVHGLAKKRNMQVFLKMPKGKILEQASKLVKAVPNIKVKLSDSRAVGNCFWGTQDFVYRHGFNVDLTDPKAFITLEQLLEAIKKEPRPEAFAVVYRILKKHKTNIDIAA